MKGRWLLVVPAVFALGGCEGSQSTGLKAPTEASEIIRDGAHGGNADFFFLPPLVAPAFSHPDFELGKFNNALRPSMRIEICELRAEHLTTAAPAGLPTDATRCVAGAPLKTFPAGTINVVNLPKRQWGWWSLFNLPPDGFYYALWNTKQSNLNRDKFYRIKVLLEGSTVPLGVADIDPMPSLRDWRNARTGEVVQMIDDILLPIPFRVEKGISCNGALLCNSATVTNDNPDGDYQVVRVEGNDGAIAGVLLPDNWLPEDGPQSVVFTITRVNTGLNDVANGTQSIPCHVNLPLQQFDGCFNFSTTPALATIPGTPGHQFTRAITVVTCIVLNEEDSRFPFLQLWSSDPGEPAKPLETASDAIVMTTEPGRSCANTPVIGSNSQNGLVRFASAGWNKFTGGVSKLFGVKTAYAVDLGIGGLTFDLSNIGPALSASIQRHTATGMTLPAGATTTATARLTGTQIHHGEVVLGTGIGGLPVTFTVASGHGSLRAIGSEAPGAGSVIVTTNANPIDESPVSGGGFAPVNWTLPNEAGTYTLLATGPAFPDTVSFTATVTAPPPEVGLTVISGPWVNENTESGNVSSVNMGEGGEGFVVHAWGDCSPWDCDWQETDGNTANWAAEQEITAIWDQGFATQNQTITYLSASRIQIVTLTDFTPEDGRTDFTMTEFFERPSLSLLGRSWVNMNTGTPGITSINIGVEGNSAVVQAFGNCEPTDCDWGTADAVTTGWNSTYEIVAVWDQGYATRTQTIQFLAPDYIQVTTFTDFTPTDGREDYTLVEYFRVNT